MAILNFGFTKIHVEKTKKTTKQVNIQSGLNIKDVKQSDVVKDGNQTAFSIQFAFETKYNPEIGSILMEGDLLYLAGKELAEDIEKSWKEHKTLPQTIAVHVFNKVLHHCNVEALLLSREINLPSPIQMPKVKNQEQKETGKAKKQGSSS